MYCNISPTLSSFLVLTTCNETKHTQCIPLVEEGTKVFSTLVLESKVDYLAKNFDEVREEVDKVLEVEEECTENVTQCVKSCHDIVKGNIVNGVSNFESLSSSVGTCESMSKEKEWKRKIACKLLEQHNVMEGEERMDSLWEIYALLDTFQSDSTTKSAQIAAVVFKKKKKKTRGLDNGDVQKRHGQSGCPPLKCCARKMNLGMGRTKIVKVIKALKGIDLFPLHHVMKRYAWQKGQKILI